VNVGVEQAMRVFHNGFDDLRALQRPGSVQTQTDAEGGVVVGASAYREGEGRQPREQILENLKADNAGGRRPRRAREGSTLGSEQGCPSPAVGTLVPAMNTQILGLHASVLVGQTVIENAVQGVDCCVVDHLIRATEQGDRRPLHVDRRVPVQATVEGRVEAPWSDVDIVWSRGLVG